MPTFGIRPFFSAHTFGFRSFFSADPFGFHPVTTTVSAIKVMRKQLRHSEYGQHDGNVGCALKVL